MLFYSYLGAMSPCVRLRVRTVQYRPLAQYSPVTQTSTLTYLAIHEGYGMFHSPHSAIIDNLIQSPAQLARLCACSHGTGPEKIVTHGVTMLGRQNGQ